MKAFHLDSTSIVSVLKRKIEFCEKQKEKIYSYLQKLKDKYLEKEISYAEFEDIRKTQKFDGKTAEEWLSFYENKIDSYKKQIKEQESFKRKKSSIIVSLTLIIIFLLAFILVKTTPTIIGLITQENAYTQDLNLILTETTEYQWNLSHPGELESLKISGIINGEGEVKIYLEDLLILDSSNIESRTISSTTQTSFNQTSPPSFSITGMLSAITGLVSEEDEETAAEPESELEPEPEPAEEETQLETPSETTETSQEEQITEQTTEEIPVEEETTEASQEEQTSNSTQVERPSLEDETVENEGILNETTESPASTNKTETPEEEKDKKEKTPKEKKEDKEPKNKTIIKRFSDVCEDTCDLSGLNLSKSNYTLRVEITNAELQLDSITYELKPEPEPEPEEEIPEEQIENITEETQNITLEETNITTESETNITFTPTNLTISNVTNITVNPKIKNAKGDTIKAKIKFTNKETDEIKFDKEVGNTVTIFSIFTVEEDEKEEIETGEYEVDIDLEETPIKKIEMKDLEAKSNISEFIRVDDAPETGDFKEVYAIDPTSLNFTEAIITVTAKGSTLYKCKDWNFTEQTCYGNWVFLQSITPGQNYTVTLTPDDPGFAESSSACSGDWNNCANAYTDDSNSASVGGSATTEIKGNWSGFGFDIPAGSTITKVTVKTKGYSNHQSNDIIFRVWDNTNNQFLANHTINYGIESICTEYTTDITSDKSWTVDDINNIKIQYENTGGGGSPNSRYWYICYIEINVTYAEEDNNFPIFSNFQETPSNNTQYSQGKNYQFNSTITSTNGTAGIEFNGVNYTASNLSTVFNMTLTNLEAGTHSYYWWAYGNGTNNNYNTSSTMYYTISKIAGQVTLFLNNSESNATINTGDSIWLNTTLTTGDSGNLYLYYNGTLINNGTNPISNYTQFSTPGMYNISAYYTGSQNYTTDWSQTLWVNVTGTANQPPTHDTPILRSDSGANLTSENITCYNQSTSDPENDAIKNIFNWYKNNNPINILNMPFEGGSNSTYTKDYSSHSNDGTVVGATWNSTGGYDGKGAYEFDGGSSYLDLGTPTELDFTGNDNFTISAWVKVMGNAGAHRPIVSKGDTQYHLKAHLDNRFETCAYDGAWQCTYSKTTLTEGVWYHLVSRFENGNVSLWQNGIHQNSTTYSGITTAAYNINIGRDAQYIERLFNGTIDNVQIFNHSLSAEQIQALYNNRTDLIVSQETGSAGENWTCEVTPNDGNQDGTTLQSGSLTISDTASNTAPQITHISPISNQNPTESSTTTVKFNVHMYDEDGVSDLNDNSMTANFTRSGKPLRENSSCLHINDIDSNTANYSCSIDMWYFDEAGNWNITAHGKDNSAESAINSSTYFQYNQLQAMVISPQSLTYSGVLPNSVNQTASDDPIIVNNTGNANLTVQINATSLYGKTDNSKAIYAGNFSVGLTTGAANPECGLSATTLSESTFTTITGAVVGRGNLSLNDGTAQEELYFCIKEIGSITSQTYSTQQEGSWIIKVALALVALAASTKKKKKKRKKKLEKDRLVKALGLIIDELKDKYSMSKAETINLVVKELKDKYKITKKETINIIRQEEEIPISIFAAKLGALEALTKYMKENLNLSYHEIAERISRNDRTIWTAYSKAKEKHTKPFEIKDKTTIPLSIFKNRKLTILESTVLYLKERGLKFSEIAALLSREQRNIWTIHSRAVKKIRRNI